MLFRSDLLAQTLEAYRAVYEQEDIQDNSAVRVAYLIGDLSLRLGQPVDARRWLLECLHSHTGTEQEGILRMARMRLEDLRDTRAA